MKQEFVTLPREVVENALDALNEADLLTEHRQDIELRRSALVALRAALEQPQNHVPDVGNMVQSGWKLVPVEPTCGMVLAGEHSMKQHDFFRLDAGYRAMLAAAPQHPTTEQYSEVEQSQAEQKPRFFYDEEDALLWTPEEAQYGPEGMTALYTHPQPKREPLTDDQIDAIAESMPGGLDGFLKGWGWRQFARAVLEAAPQPPTIKECLTDELKPRFNAHDDAERLKSVARGMSYNDQGEAVWKHTLMEIAVRLESGGYAAPQPPALEQQVEQESTCKDSLQVEQEPVAWMYDWVTEEGALVTDWIGTNLAIVQGHNIRPLYTNPQPQHEPLTDDQVLKAVRHLYQSDFAAGMGFPGDLDVARAIEAAHNIK